MIYDYEIVIVTPTYNRKHTLPRLYQSLKNQSKKDFVWLIVDDGSNDGTKEYVEELIKENLIQIIYIYQENGGKGRALNKAFSSYNKDCIFVIVDSDDYLLKNAIEIIQNYIVKYKNIHEVGAFFFYYKTKDGKILKPKGKIIKEDKILTRYEYNNKYIKNDGCVCYFGKVVKKYKYPEFEGEKYIGPTIIEMEMSKEYKIVFSPEVIGIAEYQKNGLTQSGRKLRLKNPIGMLYYSGLQQSKQSLLKYRIKYSIGAQAYRFLSKLDKKSLNELGLKDYLKNWALIPGLILKLYWEFKYREGRFK